MIQDKIGPKIVTSYGKKAENSRFTMLCKAKRQYMLTLQLGRYCLLALHDSIPYLTTSSRRTQVQTARCVR